MRHYLWFLLRIAVWLGDFDKATDCYVAVGYEAAGAAGDADEAFDDAVFVYSVDYDGVDEADGGKGDGEGDGADRGGVGLGCEEIGWGFDVDLRIELSAVKLL